MPIIPATDITGRRPRQRRLAALSLRKAHSPGQAFASSRFHAMRQLMDGSCIVINVLTLCNGIEAGSNVTAEGVRSLITLDE